MSTLEWLLLLHEQRYVGGPRIVFIAPVPR
jgi:hypothetical protein